MKNTDSAQFLCDDSYTLVRLDFHCSVQWKIGFAYYSFVKIDEDDDDDASLEKLRCTYKFQLYSSFVSGLRCTGICNRNFPMTYLRLTETHKSH